MESIYTRTDQSLSAASPDGSVAILDGLSTTSNPRSHFQSDLYIRHNARRLEHLASLGLNLTGRSVLELGAGIGDHSIFFLDRGCTVTAVEPRAENVEVIGARMRELPEAWDPKRLRVVQAAVEHLDDLPDLDTYDIVHCYGLLYHLAEPRRVLTSAANRCRDVLLLETKVGVRHRATEIQEDRENPTNSVDGMASLMTRDEVLAHLAGLFPHVYVPSVSVAHEQFPFDWDRVPETLWPVRAVFIAARSPLSLPTLLRYRHGTVT